MQAMPSGLNSPVPIANAQTGAVASQPDLRASHVFHLAEMPERKGANGTEIRNILRGQLATGEWVAVHESLQPAGAAPVALHRIGHTEFLCIRQGTVEFQHDGITERASAGDILFVANGTLHRVVNVGHGPAAYFVVAIGGDVQR